MKIISGSSHLDLAATIANNLKIGQVGVELNSFANGEKRIRVSDDVKGEDIVIVQSFSHPTNDHIIEFLLIADAVDRAGARKITAVIPWLGYSFQDKVFKPGEPISAKVVSDMVSNSDVERVFLLDLHNTSIPGFFSIPTEHLSAEDMFVEHAKEHFDQSNLVVASPDFGGLKKSRSFAEKLKTDLVNINKHRDLKTGQVTSVAASGASVENRIVLLFDDSIMSGSTVVETSKLLKESGANQVHFMATHGIFTGDAQKKLAASTVDSIITTNSVTHQNLEEKITELDTSKLFSDALSTWI